MRTWLSALVVLFILMAAIPAGATSWAKLSPAQVIEEARILAVGRVSRALPARLKGEHSIVNGMVVDVETYLGGTQGPPELTVELFGGRVCDAQNNCMAIAGGMEGQHLVGQRLLVALKVSAEGQALVPVGGPNGLVRLTESGFTVGDAARSPEEQAAWERFMKESPQRKPDRGAAGSRGACRGPRRALHACLAGDPRGDLRPADPGRVLAMATQDGDQIGRPPRLKNAPPLSPGRRISLIATAASRG